MMAAEAEMLEAGKSYLRAQEFARAELVLRQALVHQPSNPEALHLLASACQGQGKVAEAIASLQQALRIKPDLVKAYNELGILQASVGRREQACESFAAAVRLKPDYAEAHNNWGSVLRDLGNLREAIISFEQAVRFAPSFAVGHNNLGIALLQSGRVEEALTSFQQATRLRPDFAEAHQNLGITLNRLRRLPEAGSSFEQALRIHPDLVESQVGLASIDYQLGKLEQAETMSRRALHAKPDHAEAHNNLGQILLEMGRIAEAWVEYEQALRLKPEYAEGHWNRGLLLLLMGRCREGWLEYEWRRIVKKISYEPLRRPLWDGSPLAGRTILIHTEQGAGDIFQAIRYAPIVKQRGGTVIVSCPERLIPVLTSCRGIDRLVARETPLPSFDLHAPLMSLPGILGTDLTNIPADSPYLFADSALIQWWRRELTAFAGCKVGIAWQGDPKFPGDRYRSLPLRHFAPLSTIEGVRLFSLQKGLGAEQLGQATFPVTDLGRRLDETAGAFMDTAAVMKNLDVVITSDTSIAHLAGALGVRVWVAVTTIPDWRWLLGARGLSLVPDDAPVPPEA